MKKKFNYNIIVFAVVAILVVTGWFSYDMITELKDAGKSFVKEPSPSKLINDVDAASKNYSTKYEAIDLHSLSYLITNTRSVKKDSDTIVRMDNGYLAYDYATIKDEVIEETADSFKNLSDFCKDNGKPFMHIYAPYKQYFGNYPVGNDNTSKLEGDKFVAALRSRNVNTLNLAEKMIEQNKKMEDCYFITDHHWTPETAFWANGEIFKKMNSDYGFKYDSKIADLSNYNIKVYEDWFLGSQGKKVGRFFTYSGIDDISLITPKFETDLTVKDKNTRTGSFEETLIFKDKIETKELHTKNPYAAYSGGDFAVQKITNNAKKDGEKILILRDSYACALTPFMALGASEVHVLDLRRDMHGKATVSSVKQYIKDTNPDYVMTLFSGLFSSENGTKIAPHYIFN